MERRVRYLRGILVSNHIRKHASALLLPWFFALILNVPRLAWAQQSPEESSLCPERGVAFVFFNGVQNTRDDADVAVQEFKRLHGSTSPSGDPILEHEGLLQGRFELFFEALRGGGSWWSRIVNAVSSAGEILSGFVDWYQAAVLRQLTTLFANPPTSMNYAEHRLRLDSFILEGHKLLLVAHSQGNLFVNVAYNYALSKTESKSVKVVHIAPASPSLNGPHTLADKDLVINGLRLVGSVADITDNIPGYYLRPPGITGGTDLLGHGLLEIYINQALEISKRVKAHIMDALDTLEAPPTTATQGFFTATLTWNGSGDVDLHTYEPGGEHVYYRNEQGASGYLDVDNVVADGPEHYYASCDANSLQEGTYQIAVANYARADGRTATVQIASWIDGVLGTESVVLGSETGDKPSMTLFNVAVTKDPQTQKYSVALVQ
jgi:hypothetical protein